MPVDALCTSLGAPKPRRIDVDMQANASASFRRGFLSRLGSDLVLTLGMPLTAGMTLGQWTGVLAHEFGHLTQGAAMRFTYLIGAVPSGAERILSNEDVADPAAAVAASEEDAFESNIPGWWLVGTPAIWIVLSMSYYGGVVFLIWFVSLVQVGIWLFLWRTVSVEESSLVVTQRAGHQDVADLLSAHGAL